ncbi:Ni/Fe-hydrogenase cytochrome b subunit [Geomonas sp. RF6]|uniref:NrfD/PsrC family molybdoenzyme membrane anchor subunit n=1 Tax=Geomonas sp. RF6 TaxID=2897342 RepID=UPI001E4083BD|nr:Ni/Fe-hydrogenase cytochrome b subunit [Geomonas sp. RF6]UFS69426.1 Ni/Fe-hydrogenase cytochrome b subunit [Geomonas sp. RF6]
MSEKPLALSGKYRTKNYFTPGVCVLVLLALNGLGFLAARFFFGVGAVTNLNNQYPWGIWIGIDVAAGVALAAGGFTSAAIGHIMHNDEYHAILRPALLTALLGYIFVAIGVCVDLGRWYYIWHPLIMWNPNSALFEVGICVMIYLNVLIIEFIPIVTEGYFRDRETGRVQLHGFLKRFNEPVDKILKLWDRGLDKAMFLFVIAGVVLSTLHQSSLGTLMVIAGQKIHPLWQTPILPLLFFLSAVSVGFPMIIFESLIASRSFGLKAEMHVLSRLANNITPLIGVYLFFKLGDMFVRKTFVYLDLSSTQSVMFLVEIALFVVPFFLFMSDRIIKSQAGLFCSSALVICGVLVNRINNFVVAYTPPYATTPYYPSIGEISVTVGFVCLLVLIYRLIVMVFPVICVDTAELESARVPKTEAVPVADLVANPLGGEQ